MAYQLWHISYGRSVCGRAIALARARPRAHLEARDAHAATPSGDRQRKMKESFEHHENLMRRNHVRRRAKKRGEEGAHRDVGSIRPAEGSVQKSFADGVRTRGACDRRD